MIWYTDMTDTTNTNRTRRHSVYHNSKNNILNSLRTKIKSADSGNNSDGFDPMNPGCMIQREQILINKKVKNIRRVYMIDGKYKIGWVVDSDITICMICFSSFGWFNLKHHCRACGMLVCGGCSPFLTMIPQLEEENGSRVCKNCFGLKPGLVSTSPVSSGPSTPNTATTHSLQNPYNSFNSAAAAAANNSGTRGSRHSMGGALTSPQQQPNFDITQLTPNSASNTVSAQTSRRRSMNGRLPNSASDQALLNTLSNQEEQLSMLEKAMEYKYEESYKIMRQIIPLDIYKCTYETLIKEYGIPEPVASRIWSNKILWLIVMHPDDIAKIHLADFRTKYSATGLDINEMRAIWFNLPHWHGSIAQSPHNAAHHSNSSHSLHHLRQAGAMGDASAANTLEQGKYEWKLGFKARLDDLAYKESRSTLSANLIRNSAYTGYEDLYLFDYEIPLKRRFENSAGFTGSASNSQHQSFDEQTPFSNTRITQQQTGAAGLSHQQRKQNYEDTIQNSNNRNQTNSATNSRQAVKSHYYGGNDEEQDMSSSNLPGLDQFGPGQAYYSEDEVEQQDFENESVAGTGRQYNNGSVYDHYEEQNDDDMSYRSGTSKQRQQQAPHSGSRGRNDGIATSRSSVGGGSSHVTPLRNSNNISNSRSLPPPSQQPQTKESSYDPLDDIYNYSGNKNNNNSSSNGKISAKTTPVPSVNGGNGSVRSVQQHHSGQAMRDTQKSSNNSLNRSFDSENASLQNAQQQRQGTPLQQQQQHGKSRLSIGIANSAYDMPLTAAAIEELEVVDDEDEEAEEYMSGDELIEENMELHRESYGYGGSSITSSVHSNSLTANLARQVAEQQAQLEAQNILQQQQLAQIQLLHQQQLQMQQSHALNLNTSRVLNKFYQSQQHMLPVPPPQQSNPSVASPPTKHPGAQYTVPPAMYSPAPAVGSVPPYSSPYTPASAMQVGVGANQLQAPFSSSFSGSNAPSPMNMLLPQQGPIMSPPQYHNQHQQQSFPVAASTTAYPPQHAVATAAMSLDTHSSANSGTTSPPRSSADSSSVRYQTSAATKEVSASVPNDPARVHSLQRSSGVFFPEPAQPLHMPFSGGDVTPPRRSSSAQIIPSLQVSGGGDYVPPPLSPKNNQRQKQQQTEQQQQASESQNISREPSQQLTPHSVLSDGDTTASSSRQYIQQQQAEDVSEFVPPVSNDSDYSFANSTVHVNEEDTEQLQLQVEDVVSPHSPPQTHVPFASLARAQTVATLSPQHQQSQSKAAAPVMTSNALATGSMSGSSVVSSSRSVTATPPRKKLVHSSSMPMEHAAAMPAPLNFSAAVPPAAVKPQKQHFNRAEVFNSLLASIQTGDVNEANRLLNVSSDNQLGIQIGRDEASDLLLKCFEPTNIRKLQQPRELVTLLINKCHADANATDTTTGETVLHQVISSAIGLTNAKQLQIVKQITASLIEHSADIFLDDNAGNSVLSLALSNGLSWLLDEFASSGKEGALLNSGNHLLKFKYASSLILSGYSVRASEVIKQGQVRISPEDATELLSSCSGNFDAMKEPVETFELLDSMGAKL